MSDYFNLALLLMSGTAMLSIIGLLVFARMTFVHVAGERAVTHEAALRSLNWLKASTPMEAVEAEGRRDREAASLKVDLEAAKQSLGDKPVAQTNAAGVAYARNPRTGEEFDIVAGAGV